MPNIAGTTRAQTNFLRALRDDPNLPPEAWPTPFLFRKWLRRPAFRRALLSLREANRFRSSYHLARSAADAATILDGFLHNVEGFDDLDAPTISFLSSLLRLSHSADRLTHPRPRTREPLLTDAADLHSLTTAHPATTPSPATTATPQPTTGY